MKTPRTRTKPKHGYTVLLILLILIATVLSGYLVSHFYKLHLTSELYQEMAQEDKNDLKKKYKHMNGWLTIKGTNIDYPTMQPPKKDKNFYLYRDAKGKSSPSGSLFTDPYSDIALSSNIIIYGHHMSDGTMFCNLAKYQKQSYANKHSKATFRKWYKDGSTTKGTYKIFAAYKCTINDRDSYLDYANIQDEDTFNEYIKMSKRKSMISSKVKPEWGDEIITLSTCSYHVWGKNGRFVAVFVKENKSATEKQ